MESPRSPVKPGSATNNLSADTLETPADPNVLIYSNAINMAVEMLGNTLATQIGSAMGNVAESMKEMAAAFEKQQRHLQVHSSSEDTCLVGALASRPCSHGSAGGKVSLSFGRAASSCPCLEGGGGTPYDFKNHGCQSPLATPVPWDPKGDLPLQGVDSDDSPSKHSVLSLEAGDVDEFDLAVQKLTTKNTLPGSPPPPPQLGTPLMDTLYSKYMDEYQPDSVVGPCVSDDLARTVNLFYGKKLPNEKLKERRLQEMRPEKVDLLIRMTNRTVFKLNCGDVSHVRGTDIKLQHAEQNVVKSTYPIIRAVEDLQQLQQPALKPAIDKLMDGIILLTDTVQDIEQSRRELYKNVLPEGWKGLLAKPEDTHSELFVKLQEQV